MRRILASLSLILASCSTTGVTPSQALVADTSPQTTELGATTATADSSLAPPLIANGCDTWDAAMLTDLSPITNPLALIENTSTADKLVCNFVGVGGGLDTGIRIEIERTSDQPDNHYTTAGQLESPLELAGVPGVGSGRGNVRLLLGEGIGLTLAVTIRAISSDATIPRDGAYLDIRDAIAAYLVSELG